jgi:uncharacterized membrane protein
MPDTQNMHSRGALPGSTPRQIAAWKCSIAAWLALVVLGLAWELLLAPLRPGGSWLALKVLPLLLPLPAMLRGSAYAMQIALFIVLLSVLEGAARLFETLPGAALAALELLLATVFFVAAVVYLRPMKIAAKRARSA